MKSQFFSILSNMIRSAFFLLFLLIATDFHGAIKCVNFHTDETNVVLGKQYEQFVEVHNEGKEPAEVKIYLVDSLYYSDHTIYDEKCSKNPRSNHKWIFLSSNQFKIAPDETKKIPYTISVPSDASLKGSYWCALMVQEVLPIKEMEKTSDKFGVQTLLRYAKNVITTIEDTGSVNVEVVSKKMVKVNDINCYEVILENKGDLVFAPEYKLLVFDQQGKLLHEIKNKKSRVYPSCFNKYLFDCSSVENGSYTLLSIFDDPNTKVFGTKDKIVYNKNQVPSANAEKQADTSLSKNDNKAVNSKQVEKEVSKVGEPNPSEKAKEITAPETPKKEVTKGEQKNEVEPAKPIAANSEQLKDNKKEDEKLISSNEVEKKNLLLEDNSSWIMKVLKKIKFW